jgi:hypothetical protein
MLKVLIVGLFTRVGQSIAPQKIAPAADSVLHDEGGTDVLD